MNKKQKGNLIVLYGINNLGKSTQAKMLTENIMIKMGKNAEYLKYAIYNLEPSGPLINSYLREKNPYEFTAREFQILQVLNRTQFQPKLEEKLKAGTWIVAEDYIGTGIAWGMVSGIDKNLLYKLNSHLLRENLGILFQGEPFPENLDKNNIHETNPLVLEKANQAFSEIAQDFGWHIIKANQPIDQIQEQIQDIIRRKLAIID